MCCVPCPTPQLPKFHFCSERKQLWDIRVIDQSWRENEPSLTKTHFSNFDFGVSKYLPCSQGSRVTWERRRTLFKIYWSNRKWKQRDCLLRWWYYKTGHKLKISRAIQEIVYSSFVCLFFPRHSKTHALSGITYSFRQRNKLRIKFVLVSECDRHVFASGQDIEALVNSYKGRSFTACLS